jgi:hypothetical protein
MDPDVLERFVIEMYEDITGDAVVWVSERVSSNPYSRSEELTLELGLIEGKAEVSEQLRDAVLVEFHQHERGRVAVHGEASTEIPCWARGAARFGRSEREKLERVWLSRCGNRTFGELVHLKTHTGSVKLYLKCHNLERRNREEGGGR